MVPGVPDRRAGGPGCPRQNWKRKTTDPPLIHTAPFSSVRWLGARSLRLGWDSLPEWGSARPPSARRRPRAAAASRLLGRRHSGVGWSGKGQVALPLAAIA